MDKLVKPQSTVSDLFRTLRWTILKYRIRFASMSNASLVQIFFFTFATRLYTNKVAKVFFLILSEIKTNFYYYYLFVSFLWKQEHSTQSPGPPRLSSLLGKSFTPRKKSISSGTIWVLRGGRTWSEPVKMRKRVFFFHVPSSVSNWRVVISFFEGW